MGYDLIANKKGVKDKRGFVFTWPIILQETGAGYLFGYGMNTFSSGYIYDGNRPDGSPVSNNGFEISKEEALIMARLFRGYVFVKRSLREEWEKKTQEDRLMLKRLIGNKAEPPAEVFLQKIEELADFCEQSEGFKIW